MIQVCAKPFLICVWVHHLFKDFVEGLVVSKRNKVGPSECLHLLSMALATGRSATVLLFRRISRSCDSPRGAAGRPSTMFITSPIIDPPAPVAIAHPAVNIVAMSDPFLATALSIREGSPNNGCADASCDSCIATPSLLTA